MIRIRSHLPMATVITLSTVISTADMTQEAGAPEPGTGWSVVRLDLSLHVLPGAARFEAEAHLRLRLDDHERSHGPTLFLNTREPILTMSSASVDGATAEINALDPTDDSETPHERRAEIRFDEPRTRGDEIEVSISYESTDQSMQLHVTDEIALASWVEGWYPVPIVADGGNWAAGCRAPGTTELRVPVDWRTVTNGALISSTESGDERVERWRVDGHVARSFSTGSYTVSRLAAGEREVGVFLLSADDDRAREQAEILVQSLEAMEARFGPYPYPSYSIAEIPESIQGFLASSEQGFIMTKPSTFRDDGNVALFAHEAAHGWWGNLVSERDAGGIFVSESLSQYCAVLAFEAIHGEDAATEFMRTGARGFAHLQCASGYFEILRRGEDRIIAEIEKGGGYAHQVADSKGMWVYHMLRRRVGDDIFFAVLRELIETFAGREMSERDLVDAYIHAAPDADLETFFDQWLRRPGAPVLEASWTALEPGEVEIIISQVHEHEPYVLSLELDLVDGSGDTTRRRMWLRDRETRLRVPGPVHEVRLDPDHRLLIWGPEYGERPIIGS